MNGTKKFINDY